MLFMWWARDLRFYNTLVHAVHINKGETRTDESICTSFDAEDLKTSDVMVLTPLAGVQHVVVRKP